MELIYTESYEEALHEVQQLKADADDATTVYKTVSSPYGGFVIAALDATLYTDMISDELIDGLPAFPPLKKAVSSGLLP